MTLVAIGATLAAAPLVIAADSLSCRFDDRGRSQVFLGSFVSSGDPACMLEVLWEPRHLARYVTGVDSLQVITASADSQLVRYRTHWWFARNISIYRRVLRRAEGRVDFALASSSGSGPGVPRLLDSHGAYRVIPRDSGCVVEYEEHATLEPGLFTGLGRSEARRRAEAFLRGLARYVESQCEHAASHEAALSGRGSTP